MRTTTELIHDMMLQSTGNQCAALIVGFEDSSMIITSDDPNAQQLLEEATVHGGNPIAMAIWTFEGTDAHLTIRPLPEFNYDPMVREFCSKFVEAVIEAAERRNLEWS